VVFRKFDYVRLPFFATVIATIHKCVRVHSDVMSYNGLCLRILKHVLNRIWNRPLPLNWTTLYPPVGLENSCSDGSKLVLPFKFEELFQAHLNTLSNAYYNTLCFHPSSVHNSSTDEKYSWNLLLAASVAFVDAVHFCWKSNPIKECVMHWRTARLFSSNSTHTCMQVAPCLSERVVFGIEAVDNNKELTFAQ